MANDVDIIIGADSSKLQREVRDATAELDRLRTASERMGRSSVEMDRALAGAAKRLDDARTAAHRAGVELNDTNDEAADLGGTMQRLAKAMQLSGDTLGPYAGQIGDIGDAFDLMDGKTAALAIGVGSLAAAFGLALESSLDVIRNADDYNIAMGATRDRIYDARDALTALDSAFKRQKVAMAAEMAPAIETFSYAYIGMADNISRAVTWLLSGFSESSVGEWLKNNSIIWKAIEGQAERGRRIAAAARKQEEEAAAAAAVAREAEATAKLASQEAANSSRRIVHYEGEAAARRKLTDSIKGQEEALGELVTTYEDEMVITAAPPKMQIEAVFDFDAMEMNTFDELKQKNADAAGEVTNVWKDHASDIANYAASFAGSVLGMITEMSERTTGESRKERLKQFRTMKAAAIAEATINTALAATAAFAQGGGVPVGLVLAALTVAAGAVEIGMIASQQPNFHRGGIMRSDRMGLAGDERSFSATTRANEAVVLTQQAMGAFAGQLSRMNAGEPVGGGMAPVYVMVDGRASPTRQFARPDPMFGRRLA
jgi:hypothetical protein